MVSSMKSNCNITMSIIIEISRNDIEWMAGCGWNNYLIVESSVTISEKDADIVGTEVCYCYVELIVTIEIFDNNCGWVRVRAS